MGESVFTIYSYLSKKKKRVCIPFDALEEVVRVGGGPELVGEVVGSHRRDAEANRRRGPGVVRWLLLD